MVSLSMVIMGRKALCFDPTVSSPQWDIMLEDPMANVNLPFFSSFMNDDDPVMFNAEMEDVFEATEEYGEVQMDDDFRMYELKVRRCARGRAHDWTECPYAHPGEKARRRDPRMFHYSGNPCAEFRKGSCRKGDTCEFAHGVFECWLHPSRYRTQPCKDGVHCRRRICFFAHTPEQLRLLSPSYHASTHSESYDGSPNRLAMDSIFATGSFSSSPTSTLYFPHCSTPTDSPPMSPVSSLGPNSVGDLTFSMRNLHIGKATRLSMNLLNGSEYRLPHIPYAARPTPAMNALELRDESYAMMERVESGKDVRAQIYAKLSRDNALTESRDY